MKQKPDVLGISQPIQIEKDDGIRRFTVSNVYSGEKDKGMFEQVFVEEIRYVTNGSSARNLPETRNRDRIIQEKSVKNSLV